MTRGHDDDGQLPTFPVTGVVGETTGAVTSGLKRFGWQYGDTAWGERKEMRDDADVRQGEVGLG